MEQITEMKWGGFTFVEDADLPDGAIVPGPVMEQMRAAMNARADLMFRAMITPMPPAEPTVFVWPHKRAPGQWLNMYIPDPAIA